MCSKTREPLSISKLVLSNPASGDVTYTSSPKYLARQASNDPTSGLSISLSLTKLINPANHLPSLSPRFTSCREEKEPKSVVARKKRGQNRMYNSVDFKFKNKITYVSTDSESEVNTPLIKKND